MESTFASMEAFAEELHRIQMASKDFIAPSSQIYLSEDRFIGFRGMGELFPINEYASAQISSSLGVPKTYWDKCLDVPGLRDYNANSWFLKDPEKGRMVRTLDGRARAFLSDRFLRIDNYPVLDAIFPVLKVACDQYGMQIVSKSLSETRMYLQVVFPERKAEIVVGDVVRAGATIMNSEVGNGAYSVQQWVERLVCKNGLTGNNVIRQYHLGGKNSSDEGFEFKIDTIQSEIKTVALKSRDALNEILKGGWFDVVVNQMKKSVGLKIDKPIETIDRTVKLLGLPEFTKEVMLNNMISDGQLNKWGLVNSITALTHLDEFKDPDKSFMMETLGNQVLQMNERDWASLSE